jgi:hypothetical protein
VLSWRARRGSDAREQQAWDLAPLGQPAGAAGSQCRRGACSAPCRPVTTLLGLVERPHRRDVATRSVPPRPRTTQASAALIVAISASKWSSTGAVASCHHVRRS